MEISSIVGAPQLGQLLGISSSGSGGIGASFDPGGSSDRIGERLSVSPLGQLLGGESGLTPDQQAQADAFRSEMRSALQSGDFDPAAMAESAPDFLKQRAEENGASLTDAFTQLGDRVEQAKSQLRSVFSAGGGSLSGMIPMSQGTEQQYALESLLAAIGGDEE
ncbi:MAG: hypothetical protein AAGG55_01070 [Pseudomonadota bacterium]